MPATGEITSVNVSERTGTGKHPVRRIRVNANGIIDDAHAGSWHRQVSLLSHGSIAEFGRRTGKLVQPGEFAENLTVRGLDLAEVELLDRFRIGKIVLEVTQIGKKCHGEGCAIYREVGECVMPREGIFCRVVRGGKIRPGDAIEHLPRTLKALVITLSDRCSAGLAEDKSGPRVQKLLSDWLAGFRRHWIVHHRLLPDDFARLRNELIDATRSGLPFDFIFTVGGTGIGPRDIAPEAVMSITDKFIPGIMESIRWRYGAEKPNARLSRSIAAIAGASQIYTLPGSPRAANEYCSEIFKTLTHSLYMLHGLDTH